MSEEQTFRVVLIGNGTLASLGLQELLKLKNVTVDLVFCDAGDNGKDTWRKSLLNTARTLGYKEGQNVFCPKNPNSEDCLERIRATKPHVVLSLQCRNIIRKPMIEIPSLFVINLHNAPLPLLRGNDPFSWGIHDNLLQFGVTLHQIQGEGVDDGPIFCQRLWDTKETTTAWDLYNESLDEAILLIRDNFLDILKGKITKKDQEKRYVTYHPMGQFPFEIENVNWSAPARNVSAFIRSRIFPPFQLPSVCYLDPQTQQKKEIKIISARVKGLKPLGSKPGTVFKVDPHLLVSCQFGAIEIIKVKIIDNEQENHGKELSGVEFASYSKINANQFQFLSN